MGGRCSRGGLPPQLLNLTPPERSVMSSSPGRCISNCEPPRRPLGAIFLPSVEGSVLGLSKPESLEEVRTSRGNFYFGGFVQFLKDSERFCGCGTIMCISPVKPLVKPTRSFLVYQKLAAL